MKKLFVVIGLILLFIGGISQLCWAQVDFEKQGNILYAKGCDSLKIKKYDVAIDLFTQAIKAYHKAKGRNKNFDLETAEGKCNEKIQAANERKNGKSSTTHQPDISKPKAEQGKTVIVPLAKDEPDDFKILQFKWREADPLYLEEVTHLTPEIRYTCSKNITVNLWINVQDPDGKITKVSKELELKKVSGNGYWQTLDSLSINKKGKYTFQFYRTVDGIKEELQTFDAPEVKEKPQTITTSNGQTKETTLQVNENALIFDANGGIKYVTVTASSSDWDLEETSITGFKITKSGLNQISVECSPATSSSSVNGWFKVKTREQEAKITVYREGQKVIMQSYEQSIKGNPFALRTNKWNTYHWGISAGYVSKKLKYKDLDGNTNHYGLLTDKSMPGMQVGVHYEGFFMPKLCGLGIATGAYYEYYWQKGDTQTGNGGDDYYASYKEHNVYVPLNLLFRFDFSKKVNIALFGGIGGNYGVGNKVEYKNAGNDETFEEKKGLYDYDEYGIRHFFMNIEYGGSVRFGRLSVNARFFSPLTDWSEDKFYSEKPQKDMNLSVSFMF